MLPLFVVAISLLGSYSSAATPALVFGTSKLHNGSISGGSVHRSWLANYLEWDYLIDIEVGQPKNKFRVLLDTGSDDLWLPSSSCRDPHCLARSTYDRSLSTTSQTTRYLTSVEYCCDAKINGRFIMDNVHLAGLQLERQTLIEATRVVGQQFNDAPFDGLLGFKPTGGAQLGPARQDKSILVHIMEANQLGEQVFSLSLNHRDDSSQAGEMILGGLDSNLYSGEIVWSPFIRFDEWLIRLESLEVRSPANESSVDLCPTGCMATPDTGTPGLTGPNEKVAELFARVGAVRLESGEYFVNGDQFESLPDLILMISGREFVITPRMYTMPDCGGHVLFINENESESKWVVGKILIGHHYTIYDYGNKRFGLAESIHAR